MIPTAIETYLNAMQPGERIVVNRAKDTASLIEAAKEYLDAGGNIQIGTNYETITKVIAWPTHQAQLK